MSDENVIFGGSSSFEGLRIGYAGDESWGDVNYYYDNALRTEAHAIIQFTRAGCCFFEQADGRRRRVGVGQAFITEVPSPTVYGYPPEATEPYQLSFLALYGEASTELTRKFRLSYGSVVDLAIRPESYSLFHEISQRYAANSLRDRIEESTILYQLFGALYREANIEALRGDRVATCYQRIQNRFREPANINNVARDAGLTREHLARSFQARYGQTPSNMLRELRVREARMIIKSGVEDLEAVARAVGFADVRTLKRCL
jgi:AraC-like DNA-binding protein